MGLIADCAGVFAFLREVFVALPTAIQLLINAAFGGMLYIAVLKSIRR